jgi:hypothetical protein
MVGGSLKKMRVAAAAYDLERDSLETTYSTCTESQLGGTVLTMREIRALGGDVA